MDRLRGTLMDVAIARQGSIRKGASVVSFIASWNIASTSLERPITLEDYAEWWRESPATAYRHQARFRETFPGQDTPQAICDAAQAEKEHKLAAKQGVRGFGSLPAALVAA